MTSVGDRHSPLITIGGEQHHSETKTNEPKNGLVSLDGQKCPSMIFHDLREEERKRYIARYDVDHAHVGMHGAFSMLLQSGYICRRVP